jgi:hypothetical protein
LTTTETTRAAERLRFWAETPDTWVSDERYIVDAMKASADLIDELEALLECAAVWLDDESELYGRIRAVLAKLNGETPR